MTDFEDTREYKMGRAAEEAWCRFLASVGHAAVPIYGATGVDSSTKAPVMFVRDGLIVCPDVLCLKRDGKSLWHEVKSKHEPGWYRKRGRWEHGIDKSLFDEYRNVQASTGTPVWLIVHEETSPTDPNAASPLLGGSVWLGIPIDVSLLVGEHRPTWPGGKHSSRRGRRNKGGWLWPRGAMTRLSGPENP